MKRSTFAAFVLSFLVALPLAAQLGVPSFGGTTLGGAADPGDDLVTLSMTFDQAQYAPGAKVRGEIRAAIKEGWHINSIKPLDEFLIPTRLTIESEAISDTGVRFPDHVLRAFTFTQGDKIAVYEGTVPIAFEGTRTASSQTRIVATLRYQACNDSVCLAPREVKVESVLGATVAAAAPVPSGGFTPLTEAPKQRSSLFSGDIGSTLESRGLPLTLLVIFVLGIALNLTPCVYPLIPITLGYFASQTGGKRSRQVALASVYTLGIALTYSVLGVFSAMSGKLFGGWLQSPGVLLFFSFLMLVLAASMFGLFEIKVPHFISDRAGARSGHVGALTMGLLAGVVAAPCVGPVVISLIAVVSQRGEPLLGFAMFFALALGLGFPYLIGISSLPRAGGWMVTIKKALGFVLIAMAFYFLRSMIGDRWYYIGVVASLGVGALFLLFDTRKEIGGRALKVACALLLVVGGAAFVPSLASTAKQGLAWDRFSEERLTVATRSGKPVVIDFYADWCIPCKELDEKTFKDPAIMSEAGRFVRLKADLTRTTDASTVALSKKFNVVGVPTIVFLDSNGAEVKDARLTGFEPPDKFLQRMQSVR